MIRISNYNIYFFLILNFSKDAFSKIYSLHTIIKNIELNKKIHKFLEISVVLILSLQKYKFFQDNFNPEKLDIKYFADNLFENFDFQETLALCLYPVSLIKNVVNTLVFLRKNNPEILANEYNTSRLISYFALIYSCNPNIIKNPHLRSEIFDILLNILIVYSDEKNRSKFLIFLIILF